MNKNLLHMALDTNIIKLVVSMFHLRQHSQVLCAELRSVE